MKWRNNLVAIGGWISERFIPVVLVVMGLVYILVKGH